MANFFKLIKKAQRNSVVYALKIKPLETSLVELLDSVVYSGKKFDRFQVMAGL